MANLQNIAKLAEMDGVVAVDKPAGISAHDVMKSVKTHFNLVKVGHGGTIGAVLDGISPGIPPGIPPFELPEPPFDKTATSATASITEQTIIILLIDFFIFDLQPFVSFIFYLLKKSK